MSLLAQFPAYSHIQNSLQQGPTFNSRKNIIAGPNQGDYWNHSRGLETPDYREEGPWPPQGNIGSLVRQEGINNYASCSGNISISGGPNCTGVFNNDVYTISDTCGTNCQMSAPEAFGMNNFGMTGDKLTNIHGLHAYQNVRAGVPGQGPSSDYGCFEWEPRLKKSDGNSCVFDFSSVEPRTVGDWTKLPQARSIVGYQYTQ